MKYLAQLMYRTDNGVRLVSWCALADSNSHALEMVEKLTYGTGEIVGGFVTCDPYKVEQWGRTRQATY
jgi:hypothetical protein